MKRKLTGMKRIVRDKKEYLNLFLSLFIPFIPVNLSVSIL
jgi:hypothetical protein